MPFRLGHDVVCVDNDQSEIDALKAGCIPFFEPGLDLLVAANMSAGRLTFTTDLPGEIADADAIFIAVRTPSRRGDGHADLSYVFTAGGCRIINARDHRQITAQTVFHSR